MATASRQAISAASLALFLPDKTSGPEALRAVGEGLGLGAYRFTKYLTGKRRPESRILRPGRACRPGRATPAEIKALATGLSVANSVALAARDAVNEPPNVLTPEGLAELARGIAKGGKFKLKVLDKKGILAASMKLHYAVGQGSTNEPRFIHLSYSPRGPSRLVFVGKGLTFDSGGLCIKPADGMGDMKSDMGGAAAVLGSDGRPDRSSSPPSRFTASSGCRREHARRRRLPSRRRLPVARRQDRRDHQHGRRGPAGAGRCAGLRQAARAGLSIVDAATLTGACSGRARQNVLRLLRRRRRLAKRFESAADLAGEQFWRMPLLEDLREQLKSDIADLKHTGERYGGSIRRRCFSRSSSANSVDSLRHGRPVLAERAKGIYPKGARAMRCSPS